MRRAWTEPGGAHTEELIGDDGSRKLTLPDGTRVEVQLGPDPRWGMQAPMLKRLTQTTPSGLTATILGERTAALAKPDDPFSLQRLTEHLKIGERTFTSQYDATSRTFKTISPAGHESIITLDAQGRMTSEQAADFHPANFSYDQRGRLTTLAQGTGTDARTSAIKYGDEQGELEIIDALGQAQQWRFDTAGRLAQVILPDKQRIGFGYDGRGNLTAVTPPSRSAHSIDYTPAGLPSAYIAPRVGNANPVTLQAYNVDGQPTKMTRPDGQTADFDYDKAGRLSHLTLARGAITADYDTSTGYLTSLTAPDDLKLAYKYDGALLTAETWSGTIGGSVNWSYDDRFRLVSQSINGGSAVAFAYDDDDLLTKAGDLVLSRDAKSGLVMGATLDNLTSTWEYNGFGEPTSYRSSVGGQELYAVQYSYDKLGRIAELKEIIGGDTHTYAYVYDPVGRLTEVRKDGQTTHTYTYDGNGNRLSATDPNGTTNGSYEAQDRLTHYGDTTYAYTANGELLSKTASGKTSTYQYDELGNLLAVALADGTKIEYLVDGQNRRIGKKVNGTRVQGLLYQDGLRPVTELDGSGNIISRFIYASDRNVPDYMVKDGTTYRILTDHLGTPRLVVDANTGAVEQRMDYDAFGNVIKDTNPGFQPFGFAGGLYDRDTKLVRFGSRDYDAEIGRWTAKDAAGFEGGSTNLYEYAMNDPINFVDYDGTKPIDWKRIIAFLFKFWELGIDLSEYNRPNLVTREPVAVITQASEHAIPRSLVDPIADRPYTPSGPPVSDEIPLPKRFLEKNDWPEPMPGKIRPNQRGFPSIKTDYGSRMKRGFAFLPAVETALEIRDRIVSSVNDLTDALNELFDSIPTLSAPTVAPDKPQPIELPPLCHPYCGRNNQTATSTGDPHLITIDGQRYDFQGVGEFVALKSTSDNFEVQARQAPWQGSRLVSTNTAVAMNVAGDRVGIYAGATPRLLVNSEPITLTGRTMWLTNGGLIEHREGQYTVIWPDNTAVQVQIRGAWLDLLLALPKERRSKVAGLLGNFDGDPKNDLAARDGTAVTLEGLAQDEAYRQLYKVFGNSWRITQTVALFDYGPGEDTTTYTDLTFPQKPISIADLDEATRRAAEAKCRQAGVTMQPHLDNCILDIGLTGEAAFAQGAAQVETVVLQSTTLPITNTFDADAEGWAVVGDAQSGSAQPDYSATGGNPGGYTSATDDAQGTFWYWQAPPKFLGDRTAAYGKLLTFDLKQSAADKQLDESDVVLVGGGLTLVFDTSNNPGIDWTNYSIPLQAGAGWKKDSLTGANASEAEIRLVLRSLTALRIRGEYREGPDTGGLDNVVFGAVGSLIAAGSPDTTSASITIDGPSVSLKTQQGQKATVTFNGHAGQQVSLGIAQAQPAWLRVTLLSPDGQNVVGADVPGNGNLAPTLPSDGTYTILLSPNLGVIGDPARALDLILTLSERLQASITIDGPSLPLTTRAGQLADVTFTGKAGQQVSLGVAQQQGGWLRVTLLAPDGQSVGTDVPGNGNLAPTLPADGTYTIRLSPDLGVISDPARAIDVVLTLSERLQASITIDGPPLPLTTRAGQLADVTFTGKAGQQVSIGVAQKQPAWLRITLLSPDGQSVAGTDVPGNGNLAATLPADGTYTIRLSPDLGVISDPARSLELTLALTSKP